VILVPVKATAGRSLKILIVSRTRRSSRFKMTGFPELN